MIRNIGLVVLVVAGFAVAAIAQGKPATPPPAPKASVTLPAEVKWAPMDPTQPKGVQVAMIMGDGKGATQAFLKIPAGGKSGVHAHTGDYHGVLVSGAHSHGADEKSLKAMTPGSTWFEPGKAMHFDHCTSKEDCVLVVTFPNGGFDMIPGPAAAPAAKK